MKTNDIKKGMAVRLNNGWYGIMADNMRGNTRMTDVDGYFREIGSVYSHDILQAWPDKILELGSSVTLLFHSDSVNIEHTPAQLKLKERVLNSGF
jgi:hypothetical protein